MHAKKLKKLKKTIKYSFFSILSKAFLTRAHYPDPESLLNEMAFSFSSYPNLDGFCYLDPDSRGSKREQCGIVGPAQFDLEFLSQNHSSTSQEILSFSQRILQEHKTKFF